MAERRVSRDEQSDGLDHLAGTNTAGADTNLFVRVVDVHILSKHFTKSNSFFIYIKKIVIFVFRHTWIASPILKKIR